MKQKGITQAVLGRECGFSQAKISNILAGKGKIEFEDIEIICDKLDLKFKDIVSEDDNALDSQEMIFQQINKTLEVRDSNFILNPLNMAFQGYMGLYYIYLYPTISSEKELLKGTLELKPDSDENICRATLKIRTGKISREGKEFEKVYSGQVIISLPMSAVYCILINPAMAEMNFITFRHLFILNEELVCRLATLSTVSSGDSRRPSTLRVLLTRKKMVKEEEIEFLEGHLLQNHSDISIKKDVYNKLVEETYFSKSFQEIFDLLKEESILYTIDESRLRSMLDKGEDRLQCIAKLRNASQAIRYNKVGTKADEQVYQYIQERLHSECKEKESKHNE